MKGSQATRAMSQLHISDGNPDCTSLKNDQGRKNFDWLLQVQTMSSGLSSALIGNGSARKDFPLRDQPLPPFIFPATDPGEERDFLAQQFLRRC